MQDDHQQLTTLRQLNPASKVVEVEHDLAGENIQKDKKKDGKEQDDGHGHKHGEKCRHGGHKNGSRGKNYGIIIYCVFTCLSCLYLETQFFYPLLKDHSKARILSALSWFIVFMALWSYAQTVRTNNFLPKLKGAPLLIDTRLNVDTNFLSRNCQKCNYVKPPRISHCSTCGGCIMKLDHHCMWTQNCIGFRNQRSFYMFTMYMTAGVIQFWFATFGAFHEMYGQCTFFSYFQPGVYILWMVTCMSAFIVGIMIVMLSISHTMYILTNHTTLMSMKAKKVCPSPFCEFRDMILDNDSINFYDRGEIQNMRSLFGTNIFLIFFPFIRQIENDFVFEAPNPHPTPMQIAKFTGDYEAENLRQQQLINTLHCVKGLYEGKKFMIQGEIVEM